MSAEETPPTAPKKGAHMPSTVRAALRRRIDAHLRTHGSRNYDLLREDPEFAPYIGKRLGAAGEKKLDRLIRDVRATIPALRSRRPARSGSIGEADVAEARVLQAPRAVEVINVSPAQILSGGAMAVVGFRELQLLHEQALPDLDRAIRDCRNEKGDLTDGDLLAKLYRERRATVDSMGKLHDTFMGGLSKSALMQRLIERVLAEQPDDPDRARAFRADINAILREFAGLPATTSESN
jgi:hypothetical protein